MIKQLSLVAILFGSSIFVCAQQTIFNVPTTDVPED